MTFDWKCPAFTSRATARKACGRSITTLPMITDGATAFWFEFVPNT
jgi:hypothetical protein